MIEIHLVGSFGIYDGLPSNVALSTLCLVSISSFFVLSRLRCFILSRLLFLSKWSRIWIKYKLKKQHIQLIMDIRFLSKIQRKMVCIRDYYYYYPSIIRLKIKCHLVEWQKYDTKKAFTMCYILTVNSFVLKIK